MSFLSQLGEICEHVYKGEKDDVTSMGKWTLFHVHIVGSLRMGVYVKEGADGKPMFVIANAGTKMLSIGDWVNNILSPLGLSPDVKESIRFAKDFVRDHPDANIIFTGHSKGGFEAAYNAIATDRDAILFNPGPINPGAYGLGDSIYTKTMTAYIVKSEILNGIFAFYPKPNFLNVVYLPSQSWNPISNHLMGAVRSAIDEYEKR